LAPAAQLFLRVVACGGNALIELAYDNKVGVPSELWPMRT